VASQLLGRLDRGEQNQRDAPALPVEELVKRKFGYVVACQVYGKMKKNQDPKVSQPRLLHAWLGRVGLTLFGYQVR
jgi:hypothetical protein